MSPVEIVEITGADDMARAHAIRREVFCDELGVSPDEEFDGRDPDCRHYLVTTDGQAVGTARLRDTGGGEIKIERVAVLKARRGQGLGTALMRRAIADAASKTIAISAQCQAETFYLALGFVTQGGVFIEAGIEHVRMVFAGAQ